MNKNEIHARLSPEVMEKVRELTHSQNFLTISHTIRWLINLGFKVINDDIELQKKNDSVIQIIEQEFGVFFARCRDEYDPEDGQLYWFWFESKNKNATSFEADSLNNSCPTSRFKLREDAIKDCLKQKSNQLDIDSSTKSLLPSISLSDELSEDNVIDW
jgi:hypothetical protein